MFPSGPVVIWVGAPLIVGIGYKVITPAVVILPIFPPVGSVNHKLPSGPDVIPNGLLPEATAYSVIIPSIVILPIWSAYGSVNQRLPSGPDVIPEGELPESMGYSVIIPYSF